MMLTCLSLEQIGMVTTRSGVLILIDTGYLKLWFMSELLKCRKGFYAHGFKSDTLGAQGAVLDRLVKSGVGNE